MTDMQFNRRLGKREIRGQKLYVFGLRHFSGKQIQQPEQCAEVDIVAEDNPLDLKEICGMGRINLVVTEATRNGKIFGPDARVLADTAVPWLLNTSRFARSTSKAYRHPIDPVFPPSR
jgi:hypothetical protein